MGMLFEAELDSRLATFRLQLWCHCPNCFCQKAVFHARSEEIADAIATWTLQQDTKERLLGTNLTVEVC